MQSVYQNGQPNLHLLLFSLLESPRCPFSGIKQLDESSDILSRRTLPHLSGFSREHKPKAVNFPNSPTHMHSPQISTPHSR